MILDFPKRNRSIFYWCGKPCFHYYRGFPHSLELYTGVNRMWLSRNRNIFLAIILVILGLGGWVAFNNSRSQAELPAATPALTRISEDVLEGQYGMQVLLVAVTGAGGFVDVRIRILDGEKAKTLLGDANNFPAVLAANNVVLNAPNDTKSQEIRYEDGGTMFILYPNSGNSVTKGSPVNILFGDVALEDINAQ